MAKKTKFKKHEDHDDEICFDSPSRDYIPIKTTPSFDITDLFKNSAQRLAYSVYEQHDVTFLIGPAGTGKALKMDAKLYSSNGPICMKDVKIGDEIADHTGNFSKVAGIYPQGNKTVCRVWFSDETFVDCCEEHLWEVKDLNEGKTIVVNTKFVEDNCRYSDGKRRFSIVCPKAINFNRKDYDIPPYEMGTILANESRLFKKAKIASTQGVVSRFVSEEMVHKKGVSTESQKRIPEQYLYGSVDQRISLLRGLLDGVVSKKGVIFHTTDSFEFAEDVCSLIRSLGGVAKIEFKESDSGISYRCFGKLPGEISVFFLKTKKAYYKSKIKHHLEKYIDRVEVLDEKVEMQCITVDNPRHLYVTDNFTVTHNSHISCMFAINELVRSTKQRIVLTRPIVEAGESLGFLPGSFSEKTDPYMLPLYDCIHRMVPQGGSLANYIQKSSAVEPLAYMRGRSFHDSVCILDEAQNCTWGQLVLFLTRLGENSKMIVTGDPTQSDIGRDSALMDVVLRLEGVSGIGVVKFTEEHIVRHKLVSEIIKRLQKNII